MRRILNRTVIFRITVEEYDRLKSRAGDKPVSVYVRSVLFSPTVPIYTQEDMDKIAGALVDGVIVTEDDAA